MTAVCLPCQHFSGRSLGDRNETLWAAWALVGPRTRTYFGGDTGIRHVPKEAIPCCSTGSYFLSLSRFSSTCFSLAVT